MGKLRTNILTIAGFDPSGGAGVLADIKVFEQLKLQGLGVSTSITFQNEDQFLGVNWLNFDQIKSQLEPLFSRYKIEFVKIGLVENIEILEKIIDYLKEQNPKIYIIWDPIFKTSTGFDFKWNSEIDFSSILSKIEILIPNSLEISILNKLDSIKDKCENLSKSCVVYLKGGHNIEKLGYDYIYQNGGLKFNLRPKSTDVAEKHGSGCVLSAALLGYLAKGYNLQKSCLKAKEYTYYVLKSNESKLGYHS